MIGYEFFVAVAKPVGALIGGRRPTGLSQPVWFLYGLFQGLRHPINRATLVFQPLEAEWASPCFALNCDDHVLHERAPAPVPFATQVTMNE